MLVPFLFPVPQQIHTGHNTYKVHIKLHKIIIKQKTYMGTRLHIGMLQPFSTAAA